VSPQSFQSVDVGVVLVSVVVAALLVTLIGLGLRSRRRREQSRLGVAMLPSAGEAPAAARPSALDGTALMAAIDEAENAGQQARLPGLYLLLAQWRLDSGETSEAAELLRQCIRAATSAGQKDAHANARLALGDLAQAGGDPATACEHWQIARSLYRELRRSREHDAVEARMRKNGCPTDWVLTDF
jgi:tetratricopeptide (TPR) repeat protein